jgi:hypothetical protein
MNDANQVLGATFYLTGTSRGFIEKLADEFHVSRRQVAVEALAHYRSQLDAGRAERPEKSDVAISQKSSKRLTVHDLGDLAGWLTERCMEWGATRGQVLQAALGVYDSALSAGEGPKPEHAPRSKSESEPDKKPRPRPSGPRVKPALSKDAMPDRALCGSCHKQVGVRSGLLADHIAHPSVRARGQFLLCDGSGQEPAGPIVHSADTSYSNYRSQ